MLAFRKFTVLYSMWKTFVRQLLDGRRHTALDLCLYFVSLRLFGLMIQHPDSQALESALRPLAVSWSRRRAMEVEDDCAGRCRLLDLPNVCFIRFQLWLPQIRWAASDRRAGVQEIGLLAASAGPLWMSRKRPAFARRGSMLQSGHHVHLPTRSLIGFGNMAGMERGSWACSGSSRNVYWISLESRPCSQANTRALSKPCLEAQHTPRPSPTFTACQCVFLTSCGLVP
jgi:hypothetical protein